MEDRTDSCHIRAGELPSISRRQFLSASAFGLVGAMMAGCVRIGASVESAYAISSTSSSTSELLNARVPIADEISSHVQKLAEASPSQVFGTLVEGDIVERGFVVDDVLQVPKLGDIPFSMRVPEDYDGSSAYALYIHVPGWSGWYARGIGANLESQFAFSAQDFISDVILITPQPVDYLITTVDMVIALTEWALNEYNIDSQRVYLSGYSFGGETVSLVMAKRPELYSRVLHMASQWDGSVGALVEQEIPVMMVIGDDDEYYRVSDVERTYLGLRKKYENKGLAEDEIDELVVLDVKTNDYFNVDASQHDVGADLFASDPEIMGWLLS